MAQRRDLLGKSAEPNLSIWKALVGFKVIMLNGDEVLINKNDFLFLLDIEGDFLIFKHESGLKLKLHKSAIDLEKVWKVFPDAL